MFGIEMTPTTFHPLPLPNGGTLRLHLVPFATDEFSRTAFGAAGIACPPSIARSVPKRQAEFFFGRLAACAALQDFGSATTDVLVGAKREPVWPAGAVGSISHIDGLAGAAVGARAYFDGLGIDLERTARGESQTALRKTVLDPDELRRLYTIGGTLTLDELVTLVFSAKESLYKAAYGTIGRLFGFEAARLETADVSRGTITLVLAENLHRKFARGRICEVAFSRLDSETFVTALAVERSSCSHA
jgi:enterobactin synthetase component D